jgi:hypothetical protein
VTAPGSLARKLAEVEAEAAKDRDALATMVKIHDRLLNAMYEALGLDPDDDESCVAGCEEGPQGGEHYLWHIVQQRDQLRERARRYAESLARINNKMGHHHTDTCHEKYVACEAARWLTERAS